MKLLERKIFKMKLTAVFNNYTTLILCITSLAFFSTKLWLWICTSSGSWFHPNATSLAARAPFRIVTESSINCWYEMKRKSNLLTYFFSFLGGNLTAVFNFHTTFHFLVFPLALFPSKLRLWICACPGPHLPSYIAGLTACAPLWELTPGTINC